MDIFGVIVFIFGAVWFIVVFLAKAILFVIGLAVDLFLTPFCLIVDVVFLPFMLLLGIATGDLELFIFTRFMGFIMLRMLSEADVFGVY